MSGVSTKRQKRAQELQEQRAKRAELLHRYRMMNNLLSMEPLHSWLKANLVDGKTGPDGPEPALRAGYTLPVPEWVEPAIASLVAKMLPRMLLTEGSRAGAGADVAREVVAMMRSHEAMLAAEREWLATAPADRAAEETAEAAA